MTNATEMVDDFRHHTCFPNCISGYHVLLSKYELRVNMQLLRSRYIVL